MSFTTNPTLKTRIALLLVIATLLGVIVWWLDAPLYNVFFTPPLVAHVDVIVLPFVVCFCLFVWIAYDVVLLLL